MDEVTARALINMLEALRLEIRAANTAACPTCRDHADRFSLKARRAVSGLGEKMETHACT